MAKCGNNVTREKNKLYIGKLSKYLKRLKLKVENKREKLTQNRFVLLLPIWNFHENQFSLIYLNIKMILMRGMR